MTANPVDDYLAAVPEPGRSTLESLRATLRSLLPDAVEGLAYGAPAFRVGGTAVAGFAAFRAHLSYLPHSGSVLASLDGLVDGYETSKGALTFPLDEPLPEQLVDALVRARLAEIDAARTS